MNPVSRSSLGALLDELKAAHAAKDAASSVLHAYEWKTHSDRPTLERLKKALEDANSRIAQTESCLEPFRLTTKVPRMDRARI
jgi:hypothetical protein